MRLDKETPARKAMKFMFETRSAEKFKGRKRATILTTINRDIKDTNRYIPTFNTKQLKTEVDLHNIDRSESEEQRAVEKDCKTSDKNSLFQCINAPRMSSRYL